MEKFEIILAYPDGGEQIRTIIKNDEVLFCLNDVVQVLSSQNVKLVVGSGRTDLTGLVKAQLEVLEADEVFASDEHVENASDLIHPIYISQPGLLRLVLRDNSEACKKFQRWVLHEVLPSIQKYGTYPPPITNEDSDLKRIVKALLAEIEAREILEKETKARFERHEKWLIDIGKRICEIEDNNNSSEYSSISEFIELNGIEKDKFQILFGWCLKLCAENGVKAIKKYSDDTLLFPRYLLDEAYRNIIGQNESIRILETE